MGSPIATHAHNLTNGTQSPKNRPGKSCAALTAALSNGGRQALGGAWGERQPVQRSMAALHHGCDRRDRLRSRYPKSPRFCTGHDTAQSGASHLNDFGQLHSEHRIESPMRI
jgi:hypothetical protein